MIPLFVGSALVLTLTAGAGLGAWLLLTRTLGLPLFGLGWPALVQVHGFVQLFGFAGLFVMGVGLFVLPRFRGASSASRRTVLAIYLPTVFALVARAVAQPIAGLPGRELLIAASAIALVVGTALYVIVAVRLLLTGRNPHRPDEVAIGIGVCGLPLAAALAALAVAGAPLLADPATTARMEWLMLLGGLGITIFGVWARLAPAFTASLPVRYPPFVAGLALWIAGLAGILFDSGAGPWLLAAGLALVTLALGVYGPSIARQPLAGHAVLTRLAVRTAFGWAAAGALILLAASVGALRDDYLVVSAARHAFALGFVTLMIIGVAARAVPTFLDRPLGSRRLIQAAVLLANAATALRVLPQAITAPSGPANAIVGLSGLVAYAAMLAFALSLVRTFRGPTLTRAAGTAAPIQVRFGGTPPR